MIVSKEEFSEILNRIKKADELQNKANNLFREYYDAKVSENLNASSISINHEDIVINLLNKMFDLKSENYVGTILDYWCYELSYGTKWNDRCFVIDNKSIDISTPEKLYDYIIKYEYEEKNKN